MAPPPRVTQYTGAFSADAVAAMRAALANSALIGPSVLGGGFAATRGFAVMFLAEGRARLAQLAPALVPFVDAATAGDGCNAYYLNVLTVPRGAGVDPHDDGTLTSFVGLPRQPPRQVTVLYLEAPRSGGALRLHRWWGPPTRIAPVPGTLVRFRGDLVHSVEIVREGHRVSVVLEAYALPTAQLAAVPACQLVSDGYFERVLDRARAAR